MLFNEAHEKLPHNRTVNALKHENDELRPYFSPHLSII
jgi:hypothetical protein